MTKLKYTLSCKLYGKYYHHICRPELIKYSVSKLQRDKIMDEYRRIIQRSKDIGPSRLLSSYTMCAYFIALNRCTSVTPEAAYEILKDGLYQSRLFHKIMGNADSYLDPKRMKQRKKWSEQTHLCQYENDWVVDILEGSEKFELGYNYLECGVCKLCRDEGCFEFAKYLCKLDFIIADMMGMVLSRTMTLADGNDCCDFRYRHK